MLDPETTEAISKLKSARAAADDDQAIAAGRKWSLC
jgi:hypothetical protein